MTATPRTGAGRVGHQGGPWQPLSEDTDYNGSRGGCAARRQGAPFEELAGFSRPCPIITCKHVELSCPAYARGSMGPEDLTCTLLNIVAPRARCFWSQTPRASFGLSF